MSKVVLHIAADYPGPFSPNHVTVAVRDSIQSLEPGYENYVLVPRKKRKPGWAEIETLGNEVHVSVFDPLPMYFGGAARLNWRRIAETLLNGAKPQLVHSHKLSYEAAIGDALATHWNVPHLISIRGSSDTHSRNHLPLMGVRYHGFLERSARNLWLSMWAQRKIEDRTGYVIGEKDLPFPTGVPEQEFATLRRVTVPRAKRLVCVARLDDFEQKGILELISGLRLAGGADHDLGLDIIGPARPETRQRLLQEIESVGMSSRICLVEAMPRSAIIQRVSEYTAFVLLSANETFGLVFVEALLAGVPVIYLKNSGIDGYDFADKYGVRCESRQPEDVSRSICEMSARASSLRHALHLAIEAGLHRTLGSEGMKERYHAIVNAAIEQHP